MLFVSAFSLCEEHELAILWLKNCVMLFRQFFAYLPGESEDINISETVLKEAIRSQNCNFSRLLTSSILHNTRDNLYD